MYTISAIYTVNDSQETRETSRKHGGISRARDKYSEWLKEFIRFSVTCILYRRKLPDITQVLNVYVIHIKFLQNASFLRKLNPLNFALTY